MRGCERRAKVGIGIPEAPLVVLMALALEVITE